jgi:hypothetical protein
MIAVTRRSALTGITLGLLAAALITVDGKADSTPVPGKAEGTLTVNGKTINVTYAYARSVPGFADPNTPDVQVILSDVPLDAAALADDMARAELAQQGKIHAFEITIDASGTPVSTAWRHDGFKGPMPSGLSSDDVFTKKVFDGKVVEGSYKSGPSDEFFGNTYAFDVTFHAEIAH